jgi:hypothetical protein
MRFGEWLIKDREYKSINSDPRNTFTVGHNKFSDWTDAEFQAILLKPQFTPDPAEPSFAEILSEGKPGTTDACGCTTKCGGC